MTGAHLSRRVVLGGALALSTSPSPSSLLARPASSAPVPAAREGYLTIPGGRLWHWDSGSDGEPLIFLHPGTGGHDSWVHQRAFFANKGYRMITYCRWGYAPSDPSPTPRRPETEDLLAVMDALRLDRATVIGVAAGAGIVAPFIASHPGRIRRAALISSLLGIEDAHITAMIARLRPPGFADLPAEFRELGPSYRAISPDGVKRWLEIEHRRAPPPPAAVRGRTTLAALAATGCPLLLATGDADLFTPPALMRLAARHLPGCHYETIADSGHAPFWEQPDRFNQLVLDFLRRPLQSR